MRRFEDKVTLITGAATGIGRGTALRLASEGAKLFLCDIEALPLEETAKEASTQGGEVQTHTFDVSDEDQVEATVAACVERFGRLDVLCNVAGILRYYNADELTLEAWRRVLGVNLDGTFLMCRAALPHLLESGGNIVNIASTAGHAGLPYGAAYSASKAGVAGLTRALAVEFGKRGVRCNAISPGSIETAMLKQTDFPKDANMKLLLRHSALNGARGPETIASLVAFLASEDGQHVNGEDIRVDGGALS